MCIYTLKWRPYHEVYADRASSLTVFRMQELQMKGQKNGPAILLGELRCA